jgi:hypothetical protein
MASVSISGEVSEHMRVVTCFFSLLTSSRAIHSLFSCEMFGEPFLIFYLFFCPVSILAFDSFSFKLACKVKTIKTHCVAVNQWAQKVPK